MHQAFCQPLMINWHRPCHPKTISNSSRIFWWAKNPLEYLERQCIPPLLRPWNRPWIIKTRLEQHSQQPTPDFSLYFVLRYKVLFFYVFSLSKPSKLTICQPWARYLQYYTNGFQYIIGSPAMELFDQTLTKIWLDITWYMNILCIVILSLSMLIYTGWLIKYHPTLDSYKLKYNNHVKFIGNTKCNNLARFGGRCFWSYSYKKKILCWC